MPDTSTTTTATATEARTAGARLLGFILGGGGAIVDKLFDLANFLTKDATGTWHASGAGTNRILVTSDLVGSFYASSLDFTRSGVAAGTRIISSRDAGAGGVGLRFQVTADNAAEIAGTFTDVLTVTAGKRVGVGTISPISQFHVNEPTTNPCLIWCGNNNNGYAIGMITSVAGGIGAHSSHVVSVFGGVSSTPMQMARFVGPGTASGPVGTPTRLEFDTTYASTATPSNQQLKLNLVPVSANEGYGWTVDNLGRLWHHAGSTVGPTGAHLFATGNSARWQLVTAGHFQPVSDNAYALGGASNRPTVLYAVTNVINTSDEREKTWRGEANEAELRAARRIMGELGFYQWNDALAEKGPDGARYHFGVRAQRVWAIMADEGLVDPIGADGLPGATPYAFLCFDAWDEEREIIYADAVVEPAKYRGRGRWRKLVSPEVIGQVDTGETRLVREAGNRYGLRVDQLALFLVAAQEARLAALEAAA